MLQATLRLGRLLGCIFLVVIRYDFFYLDFLLLCFQKRMAREERMLFPLQDHTPGERLKHVDNVTRIRENGKMISPLFGIPFMSSSLISVDWLHCVDLGIAQIFLGSLFDLCLSTQEGDEFRKCNWLWGLMQSHSKNNRQSRACSNYGLRC